MPDIAVSADDLESSLQKKEGVLILDLRPKEKFMEGHIPTSASVAAESPQQKQAMLSKVPAAFKIILVDDGSGEAAVIDPTHPASKYVEFAQKQGLKITKVIDTHQHADHVSATRELASQTGATLYYSAKEEYKIKAEKLDEGNELQIGSKKLKVVHTPGHTAGSMTYIVDDKYVFSGDILFVEGIGRPDLRDQAEQFAQELYDTLHNKILTLPADAKIFPTHHGEGVKPTENGIYYTTVEMAKKLPLLDLSKEEFVKKAVSITTPRPMNYGTVIKVNKGIIPPNPMMIPDLEMGPNRCSVQ